MKYEVINGFYDADKHRIIEKDEKIELDNSKAKQLMAKGLVTGIPTDAEAETEEKTEKKAKK